MKTLQGRSVGWASQRGIQTAHPMVHCNTPLRLLLNCCFVLHCWAGCGVNRTVCTKAAQGSLVGVQRGHAAPVLNAHRLGQLAAGGVKGRRAKD